MSSRTTPNFCSQCGASLSPGDVFCSQCGTSVGEEPTSSANGTPSGTETTATTSAGGTSAKVAAEGATASSGQAHLRRRVEDLLVEGWDVKRDYGDRVVMVNRGVGALWIHALLLVATSPVGNLLYALYSYFPGAERVELRADGTECRQSSTGGSTGWHWRSAVGLAAGLTLAFSTALAGVLVLWVTSSLAATGIALTFLLTAVASVVFSAQFVPGVESPTTFGRRRTTSEEVVEAPSAPCSACARPVGTGVERTYAERRYVAGIPVETLNEGANRYCRACANGDPFVRKAVADREKSRDLA